jgi:DNA repair exonuclease SbcCD ATPase subunit
MEDNMAEKEIEKDEIEIVEEEEQQGEEEIKAEESLSEQSSDKEEELENYSKSVQNRISKLTQRYREEEAQRKAALEFAEAVKRQNEELKSRLDKLDQSYVGEFGSRIESQIDAAKRAFQAAYDDGDAEAMFEAQKNLSRLALDEAQLGHARKRQEEQQKLKEVESFQPPVQQPAPAARPTPDPKAESWAQKNEWFGTDQTMTYAAFGVHRQLIEDEGFDPTSDEYYTELDRRIRKEFPHKFSETRRGEAGPRVASAESTASRASSGKGRRTVKLTPSQISIAKRLNVPLEEYAKYVKES